jgi:xanthine dehydrogenase YagT iron-sulfur-binding subunit
VRLTVNGREHELAIPAGERLATTLRERLELTGTKIGCARGECGACTVLIDGRLAYSCLTLTAACDATAVTTIEGLGTPGALHPVQQAFIDHDALQCGFCTPGQILAAVSLLDRTPAPSDDEIARAMSGNLCRCGAYPAIAKAIASASRPLESP